MKHLIFVISLIFYVFLTQCSFEYENKYSLDPPESIIGDSCLNAGDTVRVDYGDYYYCAECMESADGLAWFEIVCEEI